MIEVRQNQSRYKVFVDGHYALGYTIGAWRRDRQFGRQVGRRRDL